MGLGNGSCRGLPVASLPLISSQRVVLSPLEAGRMRRLTSGGLQLGTIEGMIPRAVMLAVAAFAAGALLAAPPGADAAKKPRGSGGSLTVKTAGLPAGTPLQIKVTGRKNTVRTIKSAGSKTFRGLPLGRYVIRATATRVGSEEATPQKASTAVKLTRKAPKRLVEIKYRKSTSSNPGGASPGGSGGGNPATTEPRLRFDISDAEGVGIRASGSFGRSLGRSGISPRAVGDSDLAALKDGRLVDAVESSASPIEVNYILVRGNAVYIVFGEPISLETGQPAGEVPAGTPVCVFAKIEKATEEISCVDNALSAIGGQLSWIGWLAPPPVQFGGDGSIYYSGQIPGESLPVLRRKAPSGEITTLFSRTGLDNFVLLPSGRIAVRTCPTGYCGVNPEHLMWDPSDSTFETIPSLGILWYMVRFADDKLYFGNYIEDAFAPGMPFIGIRGYDPDTEQFDLRSWVKSAYLPLSTGNSLFNPLSNISSWCPAPGNEPTKRKPLCQGGGFQASSHLRSGGKDYVLVKIPSNWVTPQRSVATIIEADTSVATGPAVRPIEYQDLETVEYMVAVGNQMIAAGLDGSGDSLIARENLDNGSEQVLLDDPNFTVLGLDADQSRNEVIYYGFDELTLDFVLGRMDLNGNQLSEAVVDDPNFRLSPKSFQSFG